MNGQNAVASLTVVVADDSDDIRTRLIALIEPLDGVDVVATTASASETVQAVVAHRPDVLVLDLRMPEGGGLAVLDGLPALDDMPEVLVFTNYTDPEFRDACAQRGVRHFFDKTGEIDALIALLMSLAASIPPDTD